MNIARTAKIDRTRSPTRAMIASKSSCFASASPISLMSASSAFRSRVSSIARARLSAAPTCCATKLSSVLSASV
jgi:hypothetical protein